MKNDCFCSSVVHKLYNQFEALTVRANDYVWLFNHQGGENTPKNDYVIWTQPLRSIKILMINGGDQTLQVVNMKLGTKYKGLLTGLIRADMTTLVSMPSDLHVLVVRC